MSESESPHTLERSTGVRRGDRHQLTRGTHESVTRDDRGQTTLDFAIGVSVFLLLVTFVLAFLPGMVDPFVDGGSEKPVVANRVADSLSQGMLGDPTEPYVLDSTCTFAFFEEGDGDSDYDVPGGCRTSFEDNNVSVRERVGVEARGHAPYGLRIRIIGDLDGDGTSSVLCNDGGDLIESGSCSGTAYTVGSTPPDASGSVSVSRRTVYIPDDQGITATLLVEVW